MSRRDTGFPMVVKEQVWARSGGRCEICDTYTNDLQFHHRRPRQAGSTRRPDTNLPSNCLLLCRAHHDSIESRRTVSYGKGWLVRSAQSPFSVPVFRRNEWVALDDDGGFESVAAPIQEAG